MHWLGFEPETRDAISSRPQTIDERFARAPGARAMDSPRLVGTRRGAPDLACLRPRGSMSSNQETVHMTCRTSRISSDREGAFMIRTTDGSSIICAVPVRRVLAGRPQDSRPGRRRALDRGGHCRGIARERCPFHGREPAAVPASAGHFERGTRTVGALPFCPPTGPITRRSSRSNSSKNIDRRGGIETRHWPRRSPAIPTGSAGVRSRRDFYGERRSNERGERRAVAYSRDIGRPLPRRNPAGARHLRRGVTPDPCRAATVPLGPTRRSTRMALGDRPAAMADLGHRHFWAKGAPRPSEVPLGSTFNDS